ncbi:MAG: hypothetical protein WCD80_14605 [Desulfobaccales bacterium]
MRKKMYILSAGLVLVLSLCTSGAWGSVMTFPDTTLIQVWSGNQPVIENGLDKWVDVEGTRQFNTYYATYNNVSHVMTIFTNWSEDATSTVGGITFRAAALFLDFNHDGTWDAGIPLRGDDKGMVYYITSPSDYQTSQQVVGTNTDVTYGGVYTTNINAPGPPSYPVPVIVTATVSANTAPVTWTNLNNDDLSKPDFSVAINLSGVDNGFNPNDLNLDFLWGTTTCGNDVIIPLPPSLLLFGSGLLGLVAFRRLRKI